MGPIRVVVVAHTANARGFKVHTFPIEFVTSLRRLHGDVGAGVIQLPTGHVDLKGTACQYAAVVVSCTATGVNRDVSCTADGARCAATDHRLLDCFGIGVVRLDGKHVRKHLRAHIIYLGLQFHICSRVAGARWRSYSKVGPKSRIVRLCVGRNGLVLVDWIASTMASAGIRYLYPFSGGGHNII